MSTNQLSGVIHHVRRAMLRRDAAGLTDGQLLEDFVSHRDEAAFANLVQRHGPMVWGVCWRVLGNYHDAEDAFQAAFLVLMRKAASIVPREMVANWLYGVGRQTALKARATAAKRKGRERQVTEIPEPSVADPGRWHDLRPLLDDELGHLPDRYRSVIVLCDLEGNTRRETARQLGVPEGTVGGWLARARVMLAKRLVRRGAAVSSGALGTMLSQNSASAGAPASVISSTIKAAAVVTAGKAASAGLISVKVASLTQGVLKTMMMAKLKIALGVALAVAVAGAGVRATGLLRLTHAAQSQTLPAKNENLDEITVAPAQIACENAAIPASGAKRAVAYVFGDMPITPPLKGEPQITIVATIGATPIYDREVRESVYQNHLRELLDLPALERKAKEQQFYTEELHRTIEREMILSELFAMMGEQKHEALLKQLREGAAKEAEQRLRDFQKRVKIDGSEEFKAYLQAQGLTLAGLRRACERGFMMHVYVDERIKPKINAISLGDIKEYYNRHPDEFSLPDRVTMAGQKPLDEKLQGEIRKKLQAKIGEQEYHKIVDNLWRRAQPQILVK